jgi:hypothetical protein
MLDEPPLMVTMRALAGFMKDSAAMSQSERGEPRACGLVIRMKNASNYQIFLDLDKHRGVFDIGYQPGWPVRSVQRKPKDVGIGSAKVNEAGENEGIQTHPARTCESDIHSARPSLLTTVIFNPYFALSLRTNSIISE